MALRATIATSGVPRIASAMGLSARCCRRWASTLRPTKRWKRHWSKRHDYAGSASLTPRRSFGTLRLPTYLDETQLRWRIIAEDGRETSTNFDPAAVPRRDAMAFADVAYVARELTLDIALGCGYHRVSILEGDTVVGEGLLIVSPPRCHLPSELDDNG